MSGFDAAAALLPKIIRNSIYALPDTVRAQSQEFRLRIGRKPAVTIPSGEYELPGCPSVTQENLSRVLETATDASPYIASAGIENGFVTSAGGVRVGLCGQMTGEGGSWAKRGLTSVNIRIPREVRGCAERFCLDPMPSTLILSPPGAGKTTLLRDMVRIVSDGGVRVGLCDERREIAAWNGSSFGFDVGRMTDVLSDCSKSAAALQLLRTMNPQWIAMDEVTDPADAKACFSAASCGVKLLATAHACAENDIRDNRLYRELTEGKIFSRLLWIRAVDGRRDYREEWI